MCRGEKEFLNFFVLRMKTTPFPNQVPLTCSLAKHNLAKFTHLTFVSIYCKNFYGISKKAI